MTQSQGVALGWHVPRRWRSSPAAVKTSITWPSVVMALLTSWRMAASICSGVFRLVLLCLFSAACRAWSRADWREAGQTAAGSPQGKPAERRRVSQQAHVVADLRRFIAGGAEGEPSGARQTADRQPEG